tara:strand:- start:482 stop:760 length:279 start_codon:yes stop_codon:yes gene_type:complete
MGIKFTDNYSFLHFSVGAVLYYWNLSIENLIIIHTIFEILENTQQGMKIIQGFPLWPGGKQHADSYMNMLGDTIWVILGWTVARILNNNKQD